MGESKKRRVRQSREPCVCGSGKAAGTCCFDGRRWHKPAAKLGLHGLPATAAHEKCYMAELGSCDRGISGEHLVSESIMRLLAGDGEFTVGGLPWIPEGEFKTVGFKSLTANCLCGLHNSSLHPLDDAALAFFTALKACLEREADSLKLIASGHDIERWLLKTLKAMAASNNLTRGGQRLLGAFQNDLSIITMLDDAKVWPQGAGLYCIMKAGETTHNHNRFRLAPLTNDAGEIAGLWTEIMGLQFVLLLEPLDLNKDPQFAGAVYRPGEIVITYPNSTNWLVVSWEDGQLHNEALSLQFVAPVPPHLVEAVSRLPS